MIKTDKAGFTLVELLLAMAFFSFILLFVTTGFIMVNRAYNKGLTVKLVQDEGRRVIEDISRSIRVASPLGIDTTVDCLAINGNRYYWSVPIDSNDSASPKQLIKEDGKGCSDSITNPAGGENVLNDRVGVQYMEVSTVGGSNSVYMIKIVLSTAETDLVANAGTENVNCDTGSGSQYCDVVTMSTVVSTR